MRHYLSHGGGLNSFAAHLVLLDRGLDFTAVFVDHGTDWPETYQYLAMFQEWLAQKGHPRIDVIKPSVAGHDNLYEYCRERRLVPGFARRWCTAGFKIRPLMRHMKTPCVCHMGIDAGETRRAAPSRKKGIENRFPLIEEGIDREGCEQVIRDHGLPVPEKSGCFICPFQKRDQWLLLEERHPELFERAVLLEQACAEARIERGKPPIYIGSRPLPERVAKWRRAHERKARKSTARAHVKGSNGRVKAKG
ncbi:MAG: hypothetical protein ACLFOY_17305 [Desulfatibacillaceae bacterium]